MPGNQQAPDEGRDSSREGLFIVYPGNEKYLTGEQPVTQQARIVKWSWGCGVVVILGCTGISGLVFVNFLGTVGILLSTFLLALLGIGLVWIQRKLNQTAWVRLSRHGRIIGGTLVEAKWVVHEHKDSDESVSHSTQLHVDYRLVSPESRKELLGKVPGIFRHDLEGQPLPPPGTPVAILYLNDETYDVL